jgi:predicted dehydrogenase
MKPIQVIIAGAGGRGYGYAQYAKMHPERMQVVGVAEPRDFYRERMAEEFSIPAMQVFRDWREMADTAKFADAVIIATQDAMHEAPAVAFAELGYAMLLEKPLAPTLAACEHIIDAVKRADIPFAVGHVMRYTQFTRLVKRLLAERAIGELVGVDLVEPVGFWHMAHSFVRGNWRNSQESSFMLLAKSCHDLDWIHYIMQANCEQLSSFGTLSHFKPDQAPQGAGRRCLDCPIEVEQQCPYSAKRIYLQGCIERGYTGWPVNVLTEDLTIEGVTEALREGPYGRCVYYCDNDVVDHQVVNMAFDGGQTATFSMMAFTPAEHRASRLFGTRGQIIGNGETVELYDFLSDTRKTIEPEGSGNLGLEGHGGGDYGLMHAFIEALLTGDREQILSGPEETLASHALVFAAEQSRLENRIVHL